MVIVIKTDMYQIMLFLSLNTAHDYKILGETPSSINFHQKITEWQYSNVILHLFGTKFVHDIQSWVNTCAKLLSRLLVSLGVIPTIKVCLKKCLHFSFYAWYGLTLLSWIHTHNQCPKLTLARSPVACKFIVGRVEITNVHARLASKILRTISNHGHDGLDEIHEIPIM